jgi:hypothetical protein
MTISHSVLLRMRNVSDKVAQKIKTHILCSFKFNVCGSVHLGNICFILVQLNVQYSMFLKSLLAQHVSDVTASIAWSTTVVYSHRFLVSGVIIPCKL